MTANSARKSPKTLTICPIQSRFTAEFCNTSRKDRAVAGVDIVGTPTRWWSMIALASADCSTLAQFVCAAAHHAIAGVQIAGDLDEVAIGRALLHVDPLRATVARADDEGALARRHHARARHPK